MSARGEFDCGTTERASCRTIGVNLLSGPLPSRRSSRLLAVTASPTRGPGGTGADVVYEYQMILYHGHALGLRKFARRQKQILVTRDEINVIYDEEKPTF